MKVLSEEKIKVLADRNGWSPAYAEGYIDGDTFRRRGTTLTQYAQVGIDEYCLGFRAGYYERNKPDPTRSGRPDVPAKIRRSIGRS